MCMDSTIPRKRLAEILAGMAWANSMCTQFSAEENAQMFALKAAFDPLGLLNPGKVIPTLHRCAEYGKMLVRGGQINHPDLPRF